MRGADYFPREDEIEWRRLYDRQIQNYVLTNRTTRDFDVLPMSVTDYNILYNNVCTANDYRAWRDRKDRELEGERVLWKGVEELNLDKLDDIFPDRPRLAPFKLNYDTLDEVRMRFNKTVILVKGHPYYVPDQRVVKDKFYLLLEDVQQRKTYVALDDIPDLRCASPGYVKVGETNGYLHRAPARINQQGMTTNSVNIRRIGMKEYISFNGHMLVEALSTRSKTLPWDLSYRRLIDDRIVNSFRLSDTIAVYKKPNFEPVIVEYKGRRLGELIDHTIKVFDEDDVIQPWLQSDAKKVQLEIKS